MAEHPEWFRTVLREAKIRPGIVLFGNTRDLFSTGRGTDYVTLPEMLTQQLSDFSIRAVWDRVDGLRFASQDEQVRWNAALQDRVANETPAGEEYDMGSVEETESVDVPGIRVDLPELVAQYRVVASGNMERPMLVIDWSHLLITQPAHPDPTEREWILQLGKALVGEQSQRIDSDRLNQGQGLVVVVSANLGAIPPVLYQGEPRVRLLSVPTPGREERRAFFDRHADDIKIETPRPTPGTKEVADRTAKLNALTDLSDQLTYADLRQVLMLSRTLDTPLPPDRLLNLYRFGDQRSPWEELSESDLAELDERLRTRVLGQDSAVEHVATMIMRAWLGLAGLQHSARRNSPKGTLFFVGPTGVGKTELAKACAEFLFGDESACIRFDMSEFNHEHSDQRLVGAPPGYVGFEDGGQLTNAVRARPFSVLLFDEIEKAHGRVLDKFLQILEDGRLTDGRGETAWFSETVIIFTSNLGAADAKENGTNYRLHFRQRVEKHFVEELGRPELLNRLGDNIVVFNFIEDESIREGILRKKLEPLVEHLQDRWGVKLLIEESAEKHLITTARTDHGGRGLLNAVERTLLNPLTRFLFERHGKLRSGRVVRVHLVDDRMEFDLSDG